MNTKLILGIAVTHLITKKKQTIVAMLGVVFGISMFIVMISFMSGVNQFMEDAAMDGSPHVRIYKPIQMTDRKIVGHDHPNPSAAWFVVHHQLPDNDLPKIKHALQLWRQLEEMPEVEGVAPQVTSQAFFNNGSIKISGSIWGIDVAKQTALFDLKERMVEGEVNDLVTSNNSFILGKGLAGKLNAKVGDKVSITTPEGVNVLLRVVGIFSYGIGAQDETKSFASLKTVQKLMQKDPSYITDLNIKLKDFKQARPFASKISKEMSLYAEDWETANSSLLAGEKIRNSMTGIISITLLIVAGFGIYNIMHMNIMNKMKDIAILKAIGFGSKGIVGIFLLQSAIIGLLGGIVGVLIGYACCLLLDSVPFPAGEFLRVDTLPVNFDPKHYAAGLIFGVCTTLLAGYFPSKKASKVDPVQIIRG